MEGRFTLLLSIKEGDKLPDNNQPHESLAFGNDADWEIKNTPFRAPSWLLESLNFLSERYSCSRLDMMRRLLVFGIMTIVNDEVKLYDSVHVQPESIVFAFYRHEKDEREAKNDNSEPAST